MRWNSAIAVLAGSGTLALVLSLAGCDSSGSMVTTAGGPAPEPPAPMQHPLLENFPIPAGFELVPERSVAKKAGTLRIAQCEFAGYVQATEVTRFYQKYLPTAGFRLLEQRFLDNEHQLRFESSSETCNIRVRQIKKKTTFTVDLGPLPTGTSAPPGE